MRRDAMRLHLAGDVDRRVGGIRQYAEGVLSDPALDEVVVGDALCFLCDQRLQLRFPGAGDAEISQPAGQHFAIDVVLLRQCRKISLFLRAFHFMSRRKASHHAFFDCIALTFHLLQYRADIAQRQLAASRSDEPRILPNGKIIGVPITGIGRRKIQREIAVIRGSLQLQPKLMLGSERRHRFQPGFRAANLAEMPDV